MTQNCLVTKLKGTVQNNTLPEINTIYLDMHPVEKQGNSESVYGLLMIETGSDSITIISKVPFKLNVSATTEYTELNMLANNCYAFVFNKNKISETIKECVKITGNIYTLKSICCYGAGSLFDFNASVRNNFKAFKYAENMHIIEYTEELHDDLPEHILGLVCSVYDSVPTDLTKILSKWPNLKAIFYGTYLSGQTTIALSINETITNSNIEVFGVRLSGNIAELPVTIRIISQSCSTLTGSLEDFVASMRERGRTNSYLQIYSNSIWRFTYNGKAISEYDQTELNYIDNYCYLTWNETDMWFATTKPSDAMSVQTPYNYYTYLKNISNDI